MRFYRPQASPTVPTKLYVITGGDTADRFYRPQASPTVPTRVWKQALGVSAVVSIALRRVPPCRHLEFFNNLLQGDEFLSPSGESHRADYGRQACNVYLAMFLSPSGESHRADVYDSNS